MQTSSDSVQNNSVYAIKKVWSKPIFEIINKSNIKACGFTSALETSLATAGS